MSRFAPEFRPFGRPEDLDLDLSRDDTEDVVTEVLARCSTSRTSESWWAETVGSRIAGLVQLVATTDGIGAFTVPLRCNRRECEAQLQITLPLEAIGESPEAAARFSVTLPNGADIVVRPPVGADRRSWNGHPYESREEAIAVMLESLLIEGRISAFDRPAVDTIAAALAEHDPLVAFTVSYSCPTCGCACEAEIDLARLALDRLAGIQRALISDVHVLASEYGWTEAEVMAVPANRRARYRALIDEAGV